MSQEKSWEKPLSPQEIVDNASEWTLAHDVGLLKYLEHFSEKLLKDASDTNNNLDNLLNNLENATMSLDIARNTFMSLSNVQFIEKRVYDDDETLPTTENTIEPNVKKPTEEERINEMKFAVLHGLEVIDKFYNKVEVPASDSEDDAEFPCFVLQPKDPYINRPLPYVIGSEEWHKNLHVGLAESSEESDVDKMSEKFSDSDLESDLPIINRSQIKIDSESGSVLSNKIETPVANSTFNDTTVNPILQDSVLENSFAEQLAAKLDSVIGKKTQEKPEINKKPILTQSTYDYGLFSDEPPPLDVVNGRSKNNDLFSAKDGLFDDLNDDESFWGEKPDTKKFESSAPNLSNTTNNVQPKKNEEKAIGGLFDDDSDDDLFNTKKSNDDSDDDLFNTKKSNPNVKPYLTPNVSHAQFLDDEPPVFDDSKQKVKTPIGGKLPFGNVNLSDHKLLKNKQENGNKQSDDTKNLWEEDDIFAKPDLKKVAPNKDTLGLFDDPDLFGDFYTSGKKLTSGLFDDEDLTSLKQERSIDIDQSMVRQENRNLFNVESSVLQEKPLNLFDDDEDFPPSNSNIEAKPKLKDSLFSDDDFESDDIFSFSKITSKNVETPIAKSFFDDDDGLFASLNQSQKNPSVENVEEPQLKHADTKKIEENVPTEIENLNSPQKSDLFDDLFFNQNESQEDDLFFNRNDDSIKEPKKPDSKNLLDGNDLNKKDTDTVKIGPSDKVPNINLFDSIPPPDLDNWDARSENNLFDEDPFENADVTEQRSSIFDNEPPSLLYNESSGIVRDQRSRVETDDSSFDPYASSSRRFSTDVEESTEHFFVTENVQSKILENIPEAIDHTDVTSYVDLTPSGKIDDLYSESLDEIDQVSMKTDQEDEMSNKNPLDVEITEKEEEGVLRNEEKPVIEECDSPGKLKHNLNINVKALLPGAAPPPRKKSLEKSLSLDLSRDVVPVRIENDPKSKTDGVKSVEVLQSITKDRARILVKRRPSTKKGREAIRKSCIDFTFDRTKEESLSEAIEPIEQNVIPKLPAENVEFDKPLEIKKTLSKTNAKTNVKPKNLFSDSDDDDLFVNKRMNAKQKHFLSVEDKFDGGRRASFVKTDNFETPGLKSDLFDDDDDDKDMFSTKKLPPKSDLLNKNVFDDEDDDIFWAGSSSKKTNVVKPMERKPKVSVQKKLENVEVLFDPLNALNK